MRLPRARFTVRSIMAVVVVAALASLATSRVCRDYPGTDQRLVILVASVVAGAYGLGAMRRPQVLLAPRLVIWVVTPSVDHHEFKIINMSSESCFLGWIMGAPAGWVSRCLKKGANSLPAASKPQEAQ